MTKLTYQNKESGIWFNEPETGFYKRKKKKKLSQGHVRAIVIKRFHEKGWNIPKNIPNSALVGCINESAGFEWRPPGKKIKGVKNIIRKFYEEDPVMFKPPTKYFKSKFYSKPKLKLVKKKDFAQTKDFLKSYEWRQIRVQALKKNDGRCELCGQSKKDGIKLNVDHIKPRKKYPELALDINNLQVLCNECNHGKGNWDETDWRQKTV